MYFCSRRRPRCRYKHFLKGVPTSQTIDDHDTELPDDKEVDKDTVDLVIPEAISQNAIGDFAPNRKGFKVLVRARSVLRKDGKILLKRRIVYVSL